MPDNLDPSRELHSPENPPSLQYAGQLYTHQPYAYQDENSAGLVSQPGHAIITD